MKINVTRFLLLLIAALLLCVVIFSLSGCTAIQQARTDKAFNRVNNSLDLSSRNKRILVRKCEAEFPQPPPQFIKGEDRVRIDTVTNSVTDTFYSNDTTILIRTQTVTKTIERTDTIKVSDNYKTASLIEDLRAKDKLLDQCDNKVQDLREKVKDISKKAIWGWSAFGGLAILIGLFLYFKR